MLIGYARVSTREQETYLQIDALNKAGVSKIYQEKASAVSARPQLQRCLSSLKAGDILVVYKMDRVARSHKDLLAILESVQSAGAHIRSLTEPLDTSVPVGIFMVQVLGAVAQLERSIIRERALAGQIAAYNRGVRWGGSRGKLSDIEQNELRQLKQAGATLKQLMARYDISMSTVCRYLNPQTSRNVRPKLPVLGAYVDDSLSD